MLSALCHAEPRDVLYVSRGPARGPVSPLWPWNSGLVPYRKCTLDDELGSRRDSPSIHHRLVPVPITLSPWGAALVPYRESRFDVPRRERVWLPGRRHYETPPSLRHRLESACSIQRAVVSPSPVPLRVRLAAAGDGATPWDPRILLGAAGHRLCGLRPLYVAPVNAWPVCAFCKDPDVVADVFCG
jgi:hypothetical protein